VEWLRRIEVRDTRFLGRFMGRDYVTVSLPRHHPMLPRWTR
jgi:hypothetical protein